MSTLLNAFDQNYSEVRVFGNPALFHDLRIDPDTLPDFLHLYHVRHAEDGMNPVQIKPFILVNHLGSIITADPLPLDDQGSLLIKSDDDFYWTDSDCRSLDLFIQRYVEEYVK